MVLTMIPFARLTAFAETSGDFEYVVLEDGTAEITDYTGTAADLTIPSKLDGYAVTQIGDRAFYGYASLTSAIIPDSVISIGNDAFCYCESLASVTFGDNVRTIGQYAFGDCPSLTSITLPESVTSVGDGVFEKCTSLTSVIIPDGVTCIGDSAFYMCTSLTSVTIPDSVTEIGGYTFGWCTSLASITIPNGVTKIGFRAFYECTSLTSIIIPDSVTNIGVQAFYKCTLLTNVTIPNSVTEIGYGAFEYCYSLTIITMPDSVTNIGYYTFASCESLNVIDDAGILSVTKRPVPVNGVSLSKDTLSLVAGTSETLLATVSPNNATDKSLVWTSSNADIATVDNNGKVTALKKGNTTITVTTLDGNFTDSCEVKVSCAHAHKTAYAAVASTCEIQGHNFYYICDECGEVLKADGVTVTTIADETLPLADHTYIHYDEVPATHFAPGMKEHYTCSVCSKLFDKEKTEVTDTSILLISQIPHSYGDWKSDDVNHWHECGCGNIVDKENHSFVWKTDKPATETETGLKHEECTVCGSVRNESTVIPKLDHTHAMVHYNAVAATCNAEGNVEYWHCTKCGKNYADATGTTEIAVVITPIDSANHVGETKIVGKKEATCTADGYTGDVYCKDCGVKIADGTVIPAGHKLNKIEAKEATHEADGNIEYYVCSVCGKLFRDAEATEEIALEDTVIAKGEHDYGDSYKSDAENHWKECACGNIIEKAAHDFGEWSVTKEATETEKGSKERICSVCGYKQVVEIPVIGSTEEPTTPENPSESTTSNNQEDTKIPNTGNTNSVILWSSLMLITAASVTSYEILKKKKRVK